MTRHLAALLLIALFLLGGRSRIEPNAHFPRGTCEGDAIDFRYVDAEGRDAIGRVTVDSCPRLSQRAWDTLWAVRCADTEAGTVGEWAWEAEGPAFVDSLPDACLQ